MITDAYCHCGISKYTPVEDVLATMQAAGVDRAMLCQHLGEYDNSYLARVVESHPDRFAATCLVDPESPSAVADLRCWCATRCFRGLRVLADTLERNEALCREAIDTSLNLVLYALDGIAAALNPIRNILRRAPHARVVITHLGSPAIVGSALASGEALLDLADEPGVIVQLSGLSMFCPYPHEPLHGLIHEVIRRFGADRVLWGSNYPVCGDAAAFRRDLQFIRGGGLSLTETQVRQILNDTAERIWFEPSMGAITQ